MPELLPLGDFDMSSVRSTLAMITVWTGVMFATLVGGCHSNPHGTQKLEHIKRLTTVPGGAYVTFHVMNLRLVTPADIPNSVGPDDPITISLEGFETFHGRLNDLIQVSRNHWQLELVRK